MNEYDKDTKQIKYVVEGEMLHYQTNPYIDQKTGKIIIKRLASIPIEIINIGNQIDMKHCIKKLEEMVIK